MANNRKFKNYILFPKFQFDIILFTMIMVIVMMAMFYFASRHSMHEFTESSGIGKLNQNHMFYKMADYIETQQLRWFLICVGVASLLSFAIGLKYSHKMAGPMYRLQLHIKKCADEGKISPIKFRKGDYLEYFATDFNKLVDKS